MFCRLDWWLWRMIAVASVRGKTSQFENCTCQSGDFDVCSFFHFIGFRLTASCFMQVVTLWSYCGEIIELLITALPETRSCDCSETFHCRENQMEAILFLWLLWSLTGFYALWITAGMLTHVGTTNIKMYQTSDSLHFPVHFMLRNTNIWFFFTIFNICTKS